MPGLGTAWLRLVQEEPREMLWNHNEASWGDALHPTDPKPVWKWTFKS